MCSILFTNKNIDNPKVNELLKKRGPDDTTLKSVGDYNIIHNLLSLTGKITNQPVERDGIFVLFNGEIYNYLDIDWVYEKEHYKERHKNLTEKQLRAKRQRDREYTERGGRERLR